MAADWLAECHFDIVRIYETARELCHWPAECVTNENGNSPFAAEVFSLCSQWREAEVDYALVWFNRAYSLKRNTLLDDKYASYHHAIYSLACDVASAVRTAFEPHPTDWIAMVKDLNLRAPGFAPYMAIFGKIPGLLHDELAIAMNVYDGVDLPATNLVPVNIAPHQPAGEARHFKATGFVPNTFQREILKALDRRALSKKQLAEVVCPKDASRLYKNGGIEELRNAHLVEHKGKLGYFRPDAPPPAS